MTYSFPPRRYSDRTDDFFFAHRGGRGADGELADALALCRPVGGDDDYWQDETPQTMLIDEVEAIWSAIERNDDWQPLHAKIAAVRRMGAAHGAAPEPVGRVKP